jgi:hypothetical protein
MQTSRTLSSLGFAFAVGLLSGCNGSDTGPVIPASGPTASASDQRTQESDALTSRETALIGQAESEPGPAPKLDL